MRFGDCYELGNVIKTHGLKGQLMLHLDVDDPSEYKKLESVFIDIDGKLVPFFISHFDLKKGDQALVQFEDTDTLDAAKQLIGHRLYLPLGQLPKLESDQYYYHDLVGMVVIEDGKSLGHVSNVFDLPNNQLIELIHEGKEVLIPLQPEIVTSVSRDKNEIIVILPDGLLGI